MPTFEILSELVAAAKISELDPALLLAIAEVESGSRIYAKVDGRREPLIRFEGHYFDRRLPPGKRDRARSEKLASPLAGAIKNPRSQADRWRLLKRAEKIDPVAARESTSWGLGQVMGAHWAWLGYPSVNALVAAARSGAGGQTELVSRYIRKAGLAEPAARQDWKTFALGYNGPAAIRNGYDRKIADSYQKAVAALEKQIGSKSPEADFAPHARAGLKLGSSGAEVANLQRNLNALGYPLSIDGVFGPRTEAALRAFQSRSGLDPDGIAGEKTARKMAKSMPLPSLAGRLKNWARAFFARLS